MHLETPAECWDMFCQRYMPGEGNTLIRKSDWMHCNSLPVMDAVRPRKTSERIGRRYQTDTPKRIVGYIRTDSGATDVLEPQVVQCEHG